MFKELRRRVHYLFESSESWDIGYNEGYKRGLREGQDFGERIAHNRTLIKELPRILSRYSQLQVRIINKPKTTIQKELKAFEDKEVERLKMEMQNR
jgi:hypothetical protein